MADTDALLKKAQEISDLKAESAEARKRVAATYVLSNPQHGEDVVTFDRLLTDVESVRAADALVQSRIAEFEEMAQGKPRRRAKKTKPASEKPKKGGLGRRGLPKDAPAEGAGA